MRTAGCLREVAAVAIAAARQAGGVPPGHEGAVGDVRVAPAGLDRMVRGIGRIQLERQDIRYFPSLREYIMLYGINKEILDSLSKKIVIMHPGPINRGVEITSEVADSDQSIILQQVENGVAIRMAVLYLLAGRAVND